MEHLINRNMLVKRSYLIKCLNDVNIGSYLIQKRYSRVSTAKHKLIAKLRREGIVEDKTTSKDMVSIEDYSKFVRVIDDRKKTSITVDILGKETLPKLTAWRKLELIKRARRILPLPTSLTGFGDGNMPKYWTQQMKKSLIKLNRKQLNEELTIYERLTPSQRLFIENFADKVSKECPKLYKDYVNSKIDALSKPKREKTNVLKKPLQFPYELKSIIKQNNSITGNNNNNKDDKKVGFVPRLNSGLIDTEYENYLKHHRVTQFFASSIKGVKQEEYEGEIEGWSAELWRRNYGTPNPSVKSSDIPCSGCGAFLHCAETNIPGYMASERFQSLTEEQLRSELCQRCQYLNHFNVSLNVNVKSDEYPKLIAQMQNNAGIAVIMVDLLDFPCSIWPGIVDLIGVKNKIFFVANKVDLLPKDDNWYLKRILDCFQKSLLEIGVERSIVFRNICLVSAKTGWGIENLITKLLKLHKKGENIYLIGCTNVGKSTLFNALMQSDLCKFRESDLMCRATTSIWPGTTLNLIKFPINVPQGYELQLRSNRMEVWERDDIAERRLKLSLYKQTGNVSYATLSSRIGTTFRSELPFTVQSGHPFAKKTSTAQPFKPDSSYFRGCGFFHDTPGSIYKDQILNLLTTEELLKTVPREIITPRTFSLNPLQTLFIGGLARIDLLHARQHVWFTVFASHYLPIHVVYTEQAKQFYYSYLGTDILGVPIGDDERIKHWPLFVPKQFKLDGVNWTESCADVVLSTAGWVAITTGPDTHCVIKAFTPEGRGIYIRKPPLLAYAFKLRGKKILGTPCFENKLFTIDDMLKTTGKGISESWKKYDESNITNERFEKIFRS